MMVELTRARIEEALPHVARGLDQYLWLQDHRDSADILTDRMFRRRFNGFYRVRRATEWQDKFYRLLQRKKAQPVTFGQVLRALHQATGRYEASFASKLVATIRPEMPVIDSVVLANVGLSLPRYNSPNRPEQLDRLYETLGSSFRAFLRTATGRYLVKRFREEYPHARISKIKMVDLVLWQTRPNNALHRTGARGARPGRQPRTLDSPKQGMTEIPVVRNKRPSYENFIADCPSCSHENIFNRASDLGTFELIDGRNVLCQAGECGKPFRVVGDVVNSAHEMLILDCYELLARKRYMACVLNLALAYEVFFSLFFRVELLYKPFAVDPNPSPTELNRLATELRETTQKHTFAPMRALFLHHILAGRSPQDLSDAASAIAGLAHSPGDPKDSAIDKLPDGTLVRYLLKLKAIAIHVLRNRVVHQQAYRPRREEAEAAVLETRSLLFPLTAQLKLHDDINWYLRKP